MTDALFDTGSAVFSPCRTYRYRLTRSGLAARTRPGYVAWIMLNPSTADENVNDKTIRRCIGFTTREGYSSLAVVNLYAMRSPYPEDLRRHAAPCGPDNDAAIIDVARGAGLVICAWGADPMAPPRARAVEDLLADVPLWCLGWSKEGEPRHPLMLAKGTPLQPYNEAAAGLAEATSTSA